MNDLLWWIGGIVMFVLMFDLALVATGRKTISYKIGKRFALDLPRAIFYFVLGGLFVHFTDWRPKGEEDKKELFD